MHGAIAISWENPRTGEDRDEYRVLSWKPTNHSRRDFKQVTRYHKNGHVVTMKRTRCTGGRSDPCKHKMFKTNKGRQEKKRVYHKQLIQDEFL